MSDERYFAPVFIEGRERRLADRPSDFGIQPTTRYPRVWTATYEKGSVGGVAILFCNVDGSYGLLGSGGGGVLGRSTTGDISNAAFSFLDAAERDLDLLKRVNMIPPLPPANFVNFIVVTHAGLNAASVDTLKESVEHQLFRLNEAAQELITQLRLDDERSGRRAPPRPDLDHEAVSPDGGRQPE